jgi:hypothetical protein
MLCPEEIQNQLDNPQRRHTIKSPSPKAEVEKARFNSWTKNIYIRARYCPYLKTLGLLMSVFDKQNLDRSSYWNHTEHKARVDNV